MRESLPWPRVLQRAAMGLALMIAVAWFYAKFLIAPSLGEIIARLP